MRCICIGRAAAAAQQLALLFKTIGAAMRAAQVSSAFAPSCRERGVVLWRTKAALPAGICVSCRAEHRYGYQRYLTSFTKACAQPLQQFRTQQLTVHNGMIECHWYLALTLAHPPCCHLLVKGLPGTCSCRVQARRTSRRFTLARCALLALHLHSALAWQLLESVAQAATFTSKVCPQADSAPASIMPSLGVACPGHRMSQCPWC